MCSDLHVLKILISGNLFLLLTEPGGRRYWELVSSEDGVVEPGPDPADAPQEEVGGLCGCPQQEPDVEEEDNAVDAGKGPTSG